MNILDSGNAINTDGIITWQYEHSSSLKKMLEIIKDYASYSCSNLYSSLLPLILNISNTYGIESMFLTVPLDVWGGILSLKRPMLPFEENGETVYKSMSDELYRKILYHRLVLSRTNGSTKAISSMIYGVFNGGIVVKDNLDMTIRLIKIESPNNPKNTDPELEALLNLYDSNDPFSRNSRLFMSLFMLPTGVGLEINAINPDIFGLNIDENNGQSLENFVVDNDVIDHGGKFGS